jgi:hypothetical protein
MREQACEWLHDYAQSQRTLFGGFGWTGAAADSGGRVGLAPVSHVAAVISRLGENVGRRVWLSCEVGYGRWFKFSWR